MALTYEEAGPYAYDLLKRVIREYYPDMQWYEPEIRITILMAEGTKVPCLTAHGAAVASDVKVTKGDEQASVKDAPDVRFYFDRTVWDGAPEKHRRAGLARLLKYLEVERVGRKDEASIKIKADEYGRPAVKKVPPDYQTEGFYQLVEWFGDDSWEIRELGQIADQIGQDVFGFMKADNADAASIVSGRVAEIEAEAAEDDIAHQAFEALISVGHTPDQARAAIDRVLASGKRPGSVAAFVEAVYNDTEIRKPAGAETVVTLSAGGRSVTMTPDQMDRVADGDIPKPRGKGKRPAIVGAEAGA